MMQNCHVPGTTQIRQALIRMLARDPVHVGIGQERVGRVDLPIARDPATGIPKIPGTALNGACRHFSDLRLRMAGKRSISAGQSPDFKMEDKNEKPLQAHLCPVCLTFGYTSDDNESDSREGFLSIKDAHIMLFPVRTHLGTTWVTTPERLSRFVTGEERELKCSLPISTFQVTKKDVTHIDLGWLFLELAKNSAVYKGETENWTEGMPPGVRELLNAAPVIMKGLPLKRLTLVDETLFATVANDNLEVRTSVSIDPQTGAINPEKGALFSYEAIPRGTFLSFDVSEKPYWQECFEKACAKFPPSDLCYKDPFLVRALTGRYTPWTILGLAGEGLLKLGLGGMTTRGFGRLEWDFDVEEVS